MLSICKKFEFCYGHHLPHHEGKCFLHHGHNAILEIEVSGSDQLNETGSEAGMIIDFSRLKEIVKLEIIDKFDHQNLNDFFKNPTAETIVMWIKDQLMLKVDTFSDCGCYQTCLKRVRFYETPDSYAEWKKEIFS
ncbi:MAG: hypothetical protein A2Z96_01245 [Spirochaetes bacterium GWB1_48_6]|nr:MAG: hypothetical protein A2Z96_01245 [Spirochaetes bacterium GWB1_48_6]